MTQWKGYGPDNVLPADVGLTDTALSPQPVASALTYEPYYGLISKPFSLSTDPRALYKSSTHAAVLEDLLTAIRRREGLIVLTGDMGTGKTTLCRAALYQLDRKTFSTFVPDPYLSREDLLRMLLVGFGEVSVEDLKQGRLKGTPRADLGCQLYEFLTSLESVDAFAVLVIDEAQNLSSPLLDEIRALSEMEAGRRLLQIVLVGQPELRTRLKLPEMQQIAQRVTTSCELRPLSREGVNGYVAHRLSVAGGTRDRVEFSPSALDLVFATSTGTPRLVNRICDRALSHGHVERAMQITQMHVARALQDLELTPPRQEQAVPVHAPVAAPPTTPGGLFVKTSVADEGSSSQLDLNALLDLPTVSRHVNEPVKGSAPRIERTRMTGRRSTHSSAWWRRALRSLSLPALGMAVMMVAGGAAVATTGRGTVTVELPPVPPRPAVFTLLSPRLSPGQPMPAPAKTLVTTTVSAAALADSDSQTWVVQVAAFSKPERSVAMVEHLAGQGWPAYQVEPDSSTRNLTLVRVGPFRSSGEADAVRVKLRAMPNYEGAFVRNITK